MKKLLAGILGISVLFCVAATNSVTYTDSHFIKTATFNWSNLNANHTNDVVCVVTSKMFAGTMYRAVVTAASVTGTTFKATLIDGDGIDLFNSNGFALSGTAPTQFSITNGHFESALVLSVTNFASVTTTNTGSVKVYYRE